MRTEVRGQRAGRTGAWHKRLYNRCPSLFAPCSFQGRLPPVVVGTIQRIAHDAMLRKETGGGKEIRGGRGKAAECCWLRVVTTVEGFWLRVEGQNKAKS
jgi:hypothetical protein